ncbi:MAG: hypothetical protein WDW36_007320 [Sanguina aurantia]
MDLRQYLEQLPPIKRDKLYESVWTVQAVFRSLCPLAKSYVLRLLTLDSPFSQGFAASWVKPGSLKQHHTAMQQLQDLSIIQPDTDRDGQLSWVVHPRFGKQLSWAICRGAENDPEPDPGVHAATPSLEQLDAFAASQWEALQLHLLNATHPIPRMPPAVQAESPLAVRRLLASAGLLSSANGSVSERGFHFLLQPPDKQLWTVLHEYIKEAEDQAGTALHGVLSFLLQLGFRRVGQALPLGGLAPWERGIAAHMMQLGLLYPFKVHGSVHFCPTSLASSLCGGGVTGSGSGSGGASAGSSGAGGGSGRGTGGHIIVESNYRVYGYTSSPVQIAILELFCRKECLLPNLFVGAINKDSVGRALVAGIGAEEIVRYLTQHPHRNVAGKTPIVPEVVSDQLRLWEADTHRVRMDAATLYDSFGPGPLFDEVLTFANDRGLVLWRGADSFAAAESGSSEHSRAEGTKTSDDDDTPSGPRKSACDV